MVPKKTMLVLLKSIIQDAGKDFSADGQDLVRAASSAEIARTHIFKCNGAVAFAASNATHILSSLRDGDGKWATHEVEAADGTQTRVYIGGDRTERQAAEQRLGKCMLDALKKNFGAQNFTFQKKSNEVLSGWTPLCKIYVATKGKPGLLLNPDALAGTSFTEENIRACFELASKESGAPGSSVRWAPCL